MNSALMTVLTFCAAALLVGAMATMVYDLVLALSAANQRAARRSVGQVQRRASATSLFKDLKQVDTKTSSTLSDWRATIQQTLEQSGLTIRPNRLCHLPGAGSIVGRLWPRSHSSLVAAAAGFVPGLTAPWITCRVIRDPPACVALALQLPQAFDVLGRGAAGHCRSVSDRATTRSPIAEEFRHCYEQQNLGMSHVRDRPPRSRAGERGSSSSWHFGRRAPLVQSRTGGT